MSTQLDTAHWSFRILADFKCVDHYTEEQCPRCNGSGITGDHFKSLDGPQTCDECYGKGIKTVYKEIEPKPEIPESLIAHMRKAFKEWCTENCHQETRNE